VVIQEYYAQFHGYINQVTLSAVNPQLSSQMGRRLGHRSH